MQSDSLHRFLFEHVAIRGELVHLDASYQAVLEKHDYPSVVQKLLGEMMAALALLSATLKYKGRLSAQLQGNGPLSLLVVETDHERHMRAIAHWQGELPEGDLAALAGDGRLAITVEQESGERYQSVVALTGNSLADALTDYLMRSEQLDTLLWLAADQQRAAGLLIQKLPEQDGDAEDWNRISQLSGTITNTELLELDGRDVLHRLYHQEDIRLFDPMPVSFRCNCSRERVTGMLRNLGIDEIHAILEEQGSIEVACEFCNHKYAFDSVDAEQLFASEVPHNAPDTRQ